MVDGVEVVTKVGQQTLYKLLALHPRHAKLSQLGRLHIHESCEEQRVLGVEKESAARRFAAETAVFDVEHTPFAPLASREKSQVATQPHHKPQVEIKDALLHGVECHHRAIDIVEQRRCGLHLSGNLVEQLGHEECHGALTHIEGDALQWHGQRSLLDAVYLGVGTFQRDQVHEKHGLK